MYERPHVSVNVEQGYAFTYTRGLPYMSLFYLRAQDLRVYARKNYATLETHLKKRAQKFHTDDLSLQTPKTESLIRRYLVLCAFKSVKHFFTRVM